MSERDREESLQDEKEENGNKAVDKSTNSEESNDNDSVQRDLFKVPVLFGIKKKLKSNPKNTDESNVQLNESTKDKPTEIKTVQNDDDTEMMDLGDYDEDEPQDYFGYLIPKWSRMPPGNRFTIEETKSDDCLMTKPIRKEFYLFGRKDNCHIVSRHHSISRYHAVVQYGNPDGDSGNPGFYLFDMDTTHGSFINNKKIEPSKFVKLEVDSDKFHFGFSTRSYSIRSAMNRLMVDRRRKIEESIENEVLDPKPPETWVDWGMGEDADEETDLSHNPYASELNEELYISDPKKTLRGWFEREGKELNYDVEQKRPGEYCCRIEIPADDLGETLRAEATVKGKKKEAVVQAALEACRVLDKHGLLRQSFHSKKAKVKDWAENDFYDSDDDSFFDRTGDIEKKKMKRMQVHGKVETKVHTYESLMNDHKELLKSFAEQSKQIEKSKKTLLRLKSKFEAGLDDGYDLVACQMNISVLESDIKKAMKKFEETKESEKELIELINMAKPTDVPLLQPQVAVQPTSDPISTKSDDVVSNLPSVERDTKTEKNTTGTIKKSMDDGKETSVPDKSSSTTKAPKLSSETRVQSPKNLPDVDSQPKSKKRKTTRDEKTEDKINLKRDISEASQSKKEEYSNDEWTPPVGQTGDGRTHLNEKFGY